MSLLEVNRLTIAYDDVRVVDDLSFAVDAGEAVGIVGESGAGKTQTALALLGLLSSRAAVSGSATLGGEELLGAPERVLNGIRAQRMAMVFQDPSQALNPYLRVGKQLRQILKSHGQTTGADQRVIEMLRRVGLPDPERQARAFPHQLSGGMRQRAMIASALIAGPDLLIADEPTTALDVTVQAQILEMLEQIRDNTALLLITHDLGVVAGHCERMLVLESGRLVDSGATTAVFASPGHAHTRTLLAAAPRIADEFTPTMAPGNSILSIENAAVSFGDKKSRLQAVSDVSITLHEGETLAVVGESGSGKSSLVRAVLGLIPMQAGRVVYAGAPLRGAVQSRSVAQRRDLQLVFQDPVGALDPQMRVASIVGEPLLAEADSADSRRRRVIAILKKVGLTEQYLERYPHELSGGQAQRVAIARALILEPRVLVCDEAVAALDGSVRLQVLQLLRRVQEESGLAIVFISHDLAVVRTVSHRVAVMYLGRLLEVADNVQLFSRPRHPYTRALINAVPVPDPVAHPQRTLLRGEVPSPLRPPAGCVFHPRCEYARECCAVERPGVRDADGTRVACHRADELNLV